MTDLLKEHGIQFRTEGHHHCRSGWLQIDCPFCGKGSHKWHMGYNLANQYWNCWRCGPHKTIEVLSELTGLSPTKCFRLKGGIDFQKAAERKPRGQLIIPSGVGQLLPAHKVYLKRRGFVPDEIERLWRVQGIGIAAQLSWRLFIPIHFSGDVVSWTTRTIGEKEPRYVSAQPHQESMPLHDLLYGEDYVRHSVVVVEGPLDVWAIGPGAVCTFGLNYSREQVLRLSKYPIRVVCFDKEHVAQKRARKLAAELSAFEGSTYRVTLSTKDAAEARQASSLLELKRLRAQFLDV